MSSFLSLKNVSVDFNGIRVVDDVSFDVQKGEIVSLIGPNGSGKTTLVRAILGLVPCSGKILFKGRAVDAVRESSFLNAIGYVPQRFDFDKTFPLSVREFLDLFPRRFDSIRDQQALCEELHVDVLLDKKLGELSGGQLQRVLIAQALLKNPELLILDEPTSGVDAEGMKTFYEIVEHLNREHGATIILISHELSMVYALASSVVCLNRNMVCFGAPDQVLTDSVLATMYGKNFQRRGHEHH